MKKLFIIGLKDLKIVFRDRPALLMMLLAPFLLTLGLGLVSGRLSGGSGSAVSNIPVLLVNLDEGQLGQALVDIFQSDQLAELVTPVLETDPQTAQKQVNDDQYAAAVIIPAGFTDSVIPTDPQNSEPTKMIDIYINPTRPTSAGVTKTIVDEFISRVEVGRVSGEVAITQLINNGLIEPSQAMQIAQEIGMQGAENASSTDAISLKTTTNDGNAMQFDVLAYMAPGMALMFLLFTVTNGGRTLLTERMQGTLPRILVSPTTSSQVLGGKVFGIFLTGAAQMLILIIACSVLFQIKWGDPLAVLLLVFASVIGAVGWGLLLTAIAKTPAQISAVGTALMLSFGILGGSFTSRDILPDWLRTLSLVTPNAWGLDGFQTLALGGGLKNILTPISGLLVMGVVLFGISAFLFNRNGIGKG
jgi:ABC-2 type transport system permease protein